ncbi:hypothetical protein GCM10011365_15830 [Marinicella pacifica]|uniref:Sulfotransferase family protein n=1 Tax=Marinicella pacifica TaxID=1171543 RepID=A0A917FPY7_9GAMM|nr:sulfotransferase [Marinicella pacifica]GGF95333.1 hypothetical protein GCM10011365_15830 [Marinicella pacifica]
MKQNPVFIVGRFRSGTSYFWHIFNQLDRFRAWYEPLHPQLPAQIKHTAPKADHVYIQDYWTAYRALDDLSRHHRIEFGSERLYLTAQDSWPELRHYLDYLINASGDRQPVLQFNRMDFRLPWLTGFYPHAQLVYLKRDPIQLWCSQRKHIPKINRNNESYADAYELMQWCADLAPLLPFLAPQKERHGFYRFYCLYRLSVLMGTYYADVVIDLDEDVFNSDNYLSKLALLDFNENELETARTLKHVPESHELPDQEVEILTAIMTEVDGLLETSGLAAGFAKHSLAEIKQQHADFWSQQTFNPSTVIAELTQSWHQEQMEKISLLAALNEMKTPP